MYCPEALENTPFTFDHGEKKIDSVQKIMNMVKRF